MTQKKLQQSHHDKDGQSKAFVEAARDLDCDEDEAHFEEKLKKVARHKTAEKEGDTLKQFWAKAQEAAAKKQEKPLIPVSQASPSGEKDR